LNHSLLRLKDKLINWELHMLVEWTFLTFLTKHSDNIHCKQNESISVQLYHVVCTSTVQCVCDVSISVFFVIFWIFYYFSWSEMCDVWHTEKWLKNNPVNASSNNHIHQSIRNLKCEIAFKHYRNTSNQP